MVAGQLGQQGIGDISDSLGHEVTIAAHHHADTTNNIADILSNPSFPADLKEPYTRLLTTANQEGRSPEEIMATEQAIVTFCDTTPAQRLPGNAWQELRKATREDGAAEAAVKKKMDSLKQRT